MANIVYTPQVIPNISYQPVQGLCRDADYFYFFDSFFGGSIESLKKVSIQNVIVSQNNTPYSVGFPSTNLKMNDGCVSEGLLYVLVADRDSNAKYLAKYNKSDLSYNSHVDLGDFTYDLGAGVCVGANGNLFLVNFSSTTIPEASEVREYTKSGVFVQTHALSQEILEQQGITYDGSSYFISSSEGDGLIYELDGTFTVINTFEKNTPFTETEGLDFFEGNYYVNDIRTVPHIFLTRAYTPETDTFPSGWSRVVALTGQTPSSALNNNVLLITEANLPAEIWSIAQNGGGDLRACLSNDGTGQIPLRVLEFDTINETAKILVKMSTYSTSDRTVYIAYGTSTNKVQHPPNGLYGREAVVSNRSVSFYNGVVDLTGGSLVGSRVINSGTTAPNGLTSSNFAGQDNLFFSKTITDQQDYVLTAWYKPSAISPQGNDIILVSDPSGSPESSLLDDNSPDDIGIFNSPSSWLRSGVVRTINGWQRLLVVCSNTLNTRRIYINGVLESSGALGTESTSRTLVRIGSRLSNTLDWRMLGDLSGVELINENYDATTSDAIANIDYNNQNSSSTFWTTGTPENTTGGATVTADGSFNIPALTVSSSANATLPQPSASGAFDLSALTIASNASATLPQPDATGLFNLTALTVSGASSATLPQPSASGVFNLSALTVDGSVTASLPNPTLTGAFNLNTITVSGSATATTPNFTASGAFDLPALTVTGSANSTQQNPTASGNFDIGEFLFSGASSATLPQPSASAAFNLNTFNFNGSASATEPTFTASGALNLTAITVSGSGSATFPQPSASGSFALPQLQINGNITVSGLIITPSQDAILYASVGDSINYTDNTSNILYLH